MVLKNNKGDLFDNYNWSTGETTASILIHEPGTYWLCAWDHCGQNRSNDTVWITIMPAIEADLGEDKLLCENNSISLHAPHCDSCTFQWSTGSTASLITINKQGVYWLEEKNNNGCISKDSIKVNVVKCECDLFIPNSFTPNNDALNDIFKPEYYCDLSDFNLTIFNRWGQLLFQSSSIVLGWDGKFNNSYVSEGIYLFVTNYTAFINGQLQPFKTKSGTVSVIY